MSGYLHAANSIPRRGPTNEEMKIKKEQETIITSIETCIRPIISSLRKIIDTHACYYESNSIIEVRLSTSDTHVYISYNTYNNTYTTSCVDSSSFKPEDKPYWFTKPHEDNIVKCIRDLVSKKGGRGRGRGRVSKKARRGTKKVRRVSKKVVRSLRRR